MTSDQIVVRLASAQDADGVAQLRWLWRTAVHGEAGPTYEDFVARFVRWFVEHLDSHLPFVAVDDERHVGMAFLAVSERVPGVRSWVRLSGSVQSVFVLPEQRGAGVGTRLLEAVAEEGHRRALSYLTVHPTPRSMSLYHRLGFTDTGRALELRFDEHGTSAAQRR